MATTEMVMENAVAATPSMDAPMVASMERDPSMPTAWIQDSHGEVSCSGSARSTATTAWASTAALTRHTAGMNQNAPEARCHDPATLPMGSA